MDTLGPTIKVSWFFKLAYVLKATFKKLLHILIICVYAFISKENSIICKIIIHNLIVQIFWPL